MWGVSASLGVSAPGGVYSSGGCLVQGVCLLGVSALGHVCSPGVSAPGEGCLLWWGVSAARWCLLPGGVCSWGCLVQGCLLWEMSASGGVSALGGFVSAPGGSALRVSTARGSVWHPSIH